MRSIVTSAFVCLFLMGCASTGGKTYKLKSSFQPSEVEWSTTSGTSAITGQAFIQTQGGTPRTCAGTKVLLYPVSAYAEERMGIIYKSTTSGYNSAFTGTKPNFIPDDPRYHHYSRTTTCDAQGNFRFSNIPAGEYFVLSTIVWTVSNPFIPEGGAIMRRVKINKNDTVRVILTP